MKFLLTTFKIIAALYVLLCVLLFFFQEKMIFFPQKLAKDYQFNFSQKFEEVTIKAEDGKLLHGLLFKAENSKGLIFYLHGNAGALDSWGEVAKTYTDLNYDVFILDYRSFGKSEGKISGQKQMFGDVQRAYDLMLESYDESELVVLGYSIGSGLAAKVASANNPRLLILQSPYYSLVDMMKNNYSFLPTFLLKYKFKSYEYLKSCKMPIVLFHGNRDEVIYYGSSLKLQKIIKDTDVLITLDGQGHNGMTDNMDYRREIGKVLTH